MEQLNTTEPVTDDADFFQAVLYEDLSDVAVINSASFHQDMTEWPWTAGGDEGVQDYLMEMELPDLSDLLALIQPSNLLEDRLLHHCECETLRNIDVS